MPLGKLVFSYKKNNSLMTIEASEDYVNHDLSIIFEQDIADQLKIVLTASKPLVINEVKYIIDRHYLPSEKVFVNGFQSWTDGKEYSYDEKQSGISPMVKPIVKKYALDKYGDYGFVKPPVGKGVFHGFTYSYIRRNHQFEFLGSLTEGSGYTIMYHDMVKGKITLEKDVTGIKVETNYTLLDICHLKGSEKHVFDTYFEMMEIDQPRFPKMNGWTSWYNYYENINEKIILENLTNIYEEKKSIDIFQIDDGYQTHVGDWLSIDYGKFPKGVKYIASAIKGKGYKAGLWLAPFVCEKNSTIYKDKLHWLLKDNDGELVHCGHNWSGFYALDIYNQEVRDYIRNVFDTVLNEWGFDMVKLDFLYAVSLISYNNKSRGQIMCEAMHFLRDCVGDKIILGCGVPLGPSFGLVDYCRIGCDVGLDWNDKWFMKLMHRERISTLNAINNTIYRRQLSGRAFMNDPDVFLLREDNISLSQEEKLILAKVNQLFGDLLFTSDNIGDYDKELMEIFDDTMSKDSFVIEKVDEKKSGLVYIAYQRIDDELETIGIKGLEKTGLLINFTSKSVKYKGVILPAKSMIKL